MELKKYRLGDIAEIIGGVSYSPKDICTGGIRILRGGNIQNQHIELKTDDVFLPISYKNNISQIYVGYTILVASTGSVDVLGKAATCFQYTEDVQIGAFLRIIRPKADKYTMLISSALSSDYFKRYIKAQAKGTSINNITLGYLRDFEIYAPHDFTGLSHLSANIENKICLNRAINDNLEAMAKQLYDYWFVQFDFPNEDGKPYKASGGAMVWNEKLKREIPTSFDVKSLSEIIEVKDGTHDSPKPQDNGYFLLTSKHLTERGLDYASAYKISKEDYESINKRSKVDTNDILFSMIGTIGNSYFVEETNINFAIKNMALFKTSAKRWFSEYLYLYLSSCDYKHYEGNSLSGSIQKFVSLRTLRDMPILYHEDIIKVFAKEVRNIITMMVNLRKENIELTKQRDELLPLLMNGQASVNYHLSSQNCFKDSTNLSSISPIFSQNSA